MVDGGHLSSLFGLCRNYTRWATLLAVAVAVAGQRSCCKMKLSYVHCVSLVSRYLVSLSQPVDGLDWSVCRVTCDMMTVRLVGGWRSLSLYNALDVIKHNRSSSSGFFIREQYTKCPQMIYYSYRNLLFAPLTRLSSKY